MSDKKDIYILGISAFYHDSAACLVKNGRIVAAAQEERFTRKKHDPAFPARAIEYCLSAAGIASRDLGYIAYYEKPFLKFERLLLTYLTYAPVGVRSFLAAIPVWLQQKLFLKDLIREKLQCDAEILFPEHHESHAAAAFYPSPFDRAAIVTFDGVGEWATTSYGVGTGNEVTLLAQINFPHSLGLLYSAFTYYVGFRVNSGEYKLMGLAPYGQPTYADIIRRELIDIKEDGSFQLNMRYFNYCAGLTMVTDAFCRLFGGPARKPETALTQRDMDIARSIQVVTEEIMVKVAAHVRKLTGCENLCLAGGVALNCVGNGKIVRAGLFKDVWIQPAAGDAGGAVGAALSVWYQYLGNPRHSDGIQDHQQGSLLGPQYSNDDVAAFVATEKMPYEKVSDAALPRRIAEIIAGENVVGLFQGRMEFGPRALGARSILGDARSEKMQEVLNLKIKFRESFRPFAPSVLEEKAAEYFEVTTKSPYMLLTVPVLQDKVIAASRQDTKTGIDRLKVKRSCIPAVTHVDYSARVQSVSKEANPLFYRIIEEFNARTGCPVVINTSFNIRGEPIVCTPEDAYRCFMCTNMDYLVINNYVFEKAKQPVTGKYKKEDIAVSLD